MDTSKAELLWKKYFKTVFEGRSIPEVPYRYVSTAYFTGALDALAEVGENAEHAAILSLEFFHLLKKRQKYLEQKYREEKNVREE